MKLSGMKAISLIICIALMLSIVGCSTKNESTAGLSAITVQSDVQEYINTFVDPSAKITSFSQERNTISSTKTEVVCKATYSGENGSKSGVFTLIYSSDGGIWTLEDCAVDLSNSAEMVETPQNAPNESLQTEPEPALDTEDDFSIPSIAITPAESVPLEVYTPTENPGPDITLNDLYDIYSFNLEGVTYTLPVQASELLNNGWLFEYGHTATTKLNAMSYTQERVGETDDSTKNTRNSFLVDLYNPTDAEIDTADGYIAYVWYSASDEFEELQFETKKGIKIGSTRQDVLAAYGTDTWSMSATQIQYKYLSGSDMSFTSNTNGQDCLSFEFDDSGCVKDIRMELILFLD